MGALRIAGIWVASPMAALGVIVGSNYSGYSLAAIGFIGATLR